MPVYFIQAGGEGGPVKIGYTSDPAARFRELQVGHYERLTLIRLIMNGTPSDETRLRHWFKHARIRGSWFRFEEDMLEVDPSNPAWWYVASRLGYMGYILSARWFERGDASMGRRWCLVIVGDVDEEKAFPRQCVSSH